MASWTSDGKPSWLSAENDNNNNNNNNNNSNSKRQHDLETPGSSDGTTTSTSSKSFSNEGSRRALALNSNRSSNSNNNNNIDNEENDNDKKKTSHYGACSKIATMISLFFCGIFVAGAYFFENDDSLLDIQWLVFYSYQATVAGISLLLRLCCPKGTCGNIVSIIAIGGFIWSIALVIVTGVNYNNENSSTNTNTNSTTTNSTDQQEPNLEGLYQDLAAQDQSAYELTSACIGLLCSLFHIVLWCCNCC